MGVMQKVRASSYLRRTISEPFASRRLSAVMAQMPEASGSGNLAVPLMKNQIDPILEASGKLYSWASDWETIRHMLFTPFTYRGMSILSAEIQRILCRLNVLCIFVPLGIISAMSGWSDIYTFWFNFFALIPLAGLLGNCTEELALHTGDLIGGLLNATFGNAVEMILTVQSLRAGLLTVVQGALLGSILSNLLLVLGMSFFAGGLFHKVQRFNRQGAACSTSLLMLACLAFIVPTVTQNSEAQASASAVLTVSRVTACLIGVTYFLYLFFQLYTHLSLFKDDGTCSDELGAEASGFSVDDCEDWPTLSAFTSVLCLFAVTLLIALQSECLVSSIEGVSRNSGMPEAFIGVILLPIVGNAAEHATAVTVAIKDKPDLTMGVAVGSSTQIAMFMVPFAVIAGWMMDIPMSLAFSNVAIVVLVFSILIVIGIVQDGESNWLEGVMLMVAYLIIAVVFWFDPGVQSPASAVVG